MARRDARSQAVVEPQWLVEHLHDASVRVVEADLDPKVYDEGHIPGAVLWSVHRDLEDPVRRDVPSLEQLAALLGRSGVGPETTVVLYGDGNNRSATWAFWVLTYYRHRDVRLLNGGRTRWQALGLPVTVEAPRVPFREYPAPKPDSRVRATHDLVRRRLESPGVRLVDVRTPSEYRGEDDPAHPQTGIARLGHIPGAVHIPWEDAAGPDGAFRPTAELRRMYEEQGVRPEQEVVTYCRLGIRASYTWFVLRHLLGYPRVRTYDGSWTEWGNLVGVPIEKGEGG